jgi:hypothetical protein
MSFLLMAIVAGAALSIATVALLEMLGHKLYPPPAGLVEAFAAGDKAEILALIEQLPVGAFISVLAGWFFGTLAGCMLAARIAGSNPRLAAMLVAALMLAATIANLLLIPHPLWMTLAGPALVLMAGFIALRHAR